MSTPANATSDPTAMAPANISPMLHFYWSVRREFWENRSLYLAPLAVAALILVASLIGTIRLPSTVHDASLAAPRADELMERPYDSAALLLMFTAFVVGVFYCLDALQGERRDRSILFWKSLPVSDLTTVLAKASIPLVVIPLVTFVITVVTQAMILLLGSARLLGNDAGAAALWSQASLLPKSVMLFYHLVMVHGFWYAPVWGWLLLCSAWSRRSPYLWATLPLLAVAVVEKIAFNTAHFGNWLAYRFMGGPDGAVHGRGPMTMNELISPPVQFLSSPGFWFGLSLAAIFVAAAVRLRRYQGPI